MQTLFAKYLFVCGIVATFFTNIASASERKDTIEGLRRRVMHSTPVEALPLRTADLLSESPPHPISSMRNCPP